MSAPATAHVEHRGLRPSLDDRLAVSVHEAATLLGLDPRTVYRLIWSRALPARKLGTRWLIAVSTLEQILTDAETR